MGEELLVKYREQRPVEERSDSSPKTPGYEKKPRLFYALFNDTPAVLHCRSGRPIYNREVLHPGHNRGRVFALIPRGTHGHQHAVSQCSECKHEVFNVNLG